MSIRYDGATRIFSLETAHALYQMQADRHGVLLHLYWGARTDCAMDYLLQYADRGFSGNPYTVRDDRTYSMDTLPQEYPTSGGGDYRTPALELLCANGSRSCELRYAGHRCEPTVFFAPSFPHVREDDETETLEIDLRDPVIGLTVTLIYRVFPKEDAVVRSVRILNESTQPLTLLKVASMSLDMQYGPMDVLHFHGRHCMERIPERLRLPRGLTSFGTRRCMSSHHENPFVILADPKTGENQGRCFGVMLMDSGSHLEEMEVDPYWTTRVISGMAPYGFTWELAAGASFQTPEAILCASQDGFNALSDCYHRLIREHIVPREFRHAPAPALINSWETAYFHYDASTILRLAREAAGIGLDLLVLDDGWFGHREDDNSSLGDWEVNEKKLGCSLRELSDAIHDLGLQFGLWVEPEMISEDSELFRAHPEWALRDPDRKPVMSRNQMVLDMTRDDVVDYLCKVFDQLMSQARIEYLKWDFNRSVSNLFSCALPADRQGEVGHRFVLGTYRLLAYLREKWPELRIEGCCGGGGRYDAAMLYFSPQIWASDDTDAIERLVIQRGTSYGYPPFTTGCHVSVVPNHQTGRVTSLKTRGLVALSGSLGYEMDPGRLTEEEKAEIVEQIKAYRRSFSLLMDGRSYRLGELEDQEDFTAWQVVSQDRSETVLTVVCTHVRANGLFPHVCLQGLDGTACYRESGSGRVMTGAALMHGGVSLPQFRSEYDSVQLRFEKVNA